MEMSQVNKPANKVQTANYQESGNMIKTTFHNVVHYHSGSKQIPTFA